MRIELDMFSGRPNPTFEATADEERAVGALLDTLGETPDPLATAPPVPGLGYRGVLITHDGSTIRVRGTAIEVLGSGPPRVHRDDARELERTVVAIAARHVSPDTHRVLRTMVGEQ